MNLNYEKARTLLASGIAEKHYTYDQTGIISMNLGGKYWGYVGSGRADEYVVVCKDNSVQFYGNVSDDLRCVDGTRNNRHMEIVPW